MHESSLLRGLVKQLEQIAVEHGADCITGVKLRVRDSGRYSSAHFCDHLRAINAGTMLEKADVDVEMVLDPVHSGSPEITILSIEVPE